MQNNDYLYPMQTTKNIIETTNTPTYKELIDNSNGFFTFEPNENTEIHVSSSDMSIRVEYFRSANHMVDPFKVDNFNGLYGSMGYLSIEEKFNEILNSIKS